jgi:acyl carrier protein
MNELEAIEQQIYAAIRKVKPSLKTIPLAPETPFENLGLESLELAIVVFELEDAYDLSILDEGLDKFETIAEAREVVSKLLGRKMKRVEGAA